AVDVAEAALRSAEARRRASGCRERVTLVRSSLDSPWPRGPFDLLVLSEVAYYLEAETLAEVLRRECPRLQRGANIVAAHWRHPVADYPLTGDAAHDVIAQTPGLTSMGRYRDSDVVIDVFDTGDAWSVAARERVPGAR
ncbi:MAG TPA: class I SAM-dependent methyltransferase, partial [Mycobacterium sp.]|nr:class I SAM-dependent methyltransferase [Mycobacterium sp.]